MNVALLNLLADIGIVERERLQSVKEGDYLVRAPCPVHDGRRPDSFVLATNKWFCNSNERCSPTFGHNLEGLLVGLVHRMTGVKMDFGDARTWAKRNVEKLGRTIDEWKNLPRPRAGRRLSGCSPFPCSRELVRRVLTIPDWYFADRGFSLDTLRRYAIGRSRGRGYFPSGEQVFVPMPDLDDRSLCVGYLARSTRWDSGGSRWRFSPGFPQSHRLFNYTTARSENRRTGRLILVEGVADALRVVEAGFPDVVALLGASVDNAQLERLSRLRLDEVIVLADADDGGDGMTKDVERRIGSRAGSVRRLELPPNVKDIGELSTSSATTFLTRALAA